jgi:hypothetical protein
VDRIDEGRIVWLSDVRDLRGEPVGPHYAIILTTNEEYEAGEEIKAVVVSSKLQHAKPDEMVLLPWANARHPQTGFDRQCAAMCGWVVSVEETSIARYGNRIYGKLLLDIVECIARVRARRQSTSQS